MEQTTIITNFKCERCDHVWYPRAPIKPKACPNCNSRVWQKPKKQK